MNRLVKGKKNLVLTSVFITILSLLLTAGSIFLIVWGVKNLRDSLAVSIVLIIVGALLALMFLAGVVFGFVFFFTGKSLVALNGSVAEDNLGIGTANMNKCSKCGTKVENGDKFCPKCGQDVSDAKKCDKCGVLNKLDSHVCTACGEKLNK